MLFTAPLGLIGVVLTLLDFNQPFGFNAILGIVGLADILMRNVPIRWTGHPPRRRPSSSRRLVEWRGGMRAPEPGLDRRL